MPWIRLSDDYIDDEKFQALGDRAFRLWHETMAYCRRHQTDGLIPFAIMRSRRSYSKAAEKQLATPARPGIAPLWELIPCTGYKVHNYLAWNLSKEEESNERAGAAARMRKFRTKGPEGGQCYGVTGGVTNAVTPTVTNGEVPDWIGKDRKVVTEGVQGKPKSAPRPSASKRPIFTGQRITVFEWMLDDLMRMLGEKANDFDLDEWFYAADAKAMKLAVIRDDWWPWLKAETKAEAIRRGLGNEPVVDKIAEQNRKDADAALALLRAKERVS